MYTPSVETALLFFQNSHSVSAYRIFSNISPLVVGFVPPFMVVRSLGSLSTNRPFWLWAFLSPRWTNSKRGVINIKRNRYWAYLIIVICTPNQKTAQQALRHRMEMADQAGITIRGNGRCPEYSGHFSVWHIRLRPVDFEYTLDSSWAGSAPMVWTWFVRSTGFGNWLQWECQDAWRWSGPVWPKYIPTNLTTADQTKTQGWWSGGNCLGRWTGCKKRRGQVGYAA